MQKTEVMVFSKKKQPPKIKVRLNGEMLKQVNQFKYLGSTMKSDAKSTVDIRCRIAAAKSAFTEMKTILTHLKVPFELRYRIFKCYITPILLYGSKNWTLNKIDIRKIKAAEMWFLRRMEKVKWTEKITTEEVMNKTIQKSNIMSDISKRQISFFGHIMRKNKLEYLAVTGKIVGKRTRGRKRTLFTDQLIEWTNCDNTIEPIRKASKRELTAAGVY